MRKSTFLWLLLAVITGGILYHTSQQVTDGRTKLAKLERASQREEESMRVLQAEWSYLNQPERLEKLAHEYLQLAPMKGKQFTTISAIPAKDDGIPAADDAALVEEKPSSTDKTHSGSAAALAATEPAAGTAVPAPVTAPAAVPVIKAVIAAPVVAPKPVATKTIAPFKPQSVKAVVKPSPAIEKAATRRDFLDVMKSLEAAQ